VTVTLTSASEKGEVAMKLRLCTWSKEGRVRAEPGMLGSYVSPSRGGRGRVVATTLHLLEGGDVENTRVVRGER